MNSNKADIDNALIDVRKAYRLLYDYQRAALDVASYISVQLGFTPYWGGVPRFSDCSPRSEKGSLDCWAWDWLNLIFYEFRFGKCIGENEELRFSILLFSDTGYFISDTLNGELIEQKKDVSSFAGVERSATMIGFLLYKSSIAERKNMDDAKAQFLLCNSIQSKDACRRFIENEGEVPTELKDAGFLGKCYDFSCFCDAASSDAIINELVNAAPSRGFQLERIKKAV